MSYTAMSCERGWKRIEADNNKKLDRVKFLKNVFRVLRPALARTAKEKWTLSIHTQTYQRMHFQCLSTLSSMANDGWWWWWCMWVLCSVTISMVLLDLLLCLIANFLQSLGSGFVLLLHKTNRSASLALYSHSQPPFISAYIHKRCRTSLAFLLLFFQPSNICLICMLWQKK